ncbi:MAG: hypothetical protein FWG74_08390, partial [Planctomycetes bacterium]|nr:hypothetical protein [Planctomycetota bacterium]
MKNQTLGFGLSAVGTATTSAAEAVAVPTAHSPQPTAKPYNGEDLMELARKEAGKLKLPESRREDAEMEYVLGALEAAKNNDGTRDVRAYQRTRGRGAMIDFLR